MLLCVLLVYHTVFSKILVTALSFDNLRYFPWYTHLSAHSKCLNWETVFIVSEDIQSIFRI